MNKTLKELGYSSYEEALRKNFHNFPEEIKKLIRLQNLIDDLPEELSQE